MSILYFLDLLWIEYKKSKVLLLRLVLHWPIPFTLTTNRVPSGKASRVDTNVNQKSGQVTKQVSDCLSSEGRFGN